MPKKAGTEWLKALTKILNELEKAQYKETLWYLDKIPKSRKNTRSRVTMAQTIIEHYGEDESISEMNKIMDEIPRRDPKIQNLLRPFVKQLKKKKTGQKRKHGTNSEDQQDSPAAKRRKNMEPLQRRRNGVLQLVGFEKNNVVSSSDSSDEENQADDPGSPQSDKKLEIPRWRTLIGNLAELKKGEVLSVVGKVVGKFGLRTYQTKKKEKKSFFYLGVGDEYGCVKVMVYGKERFKTFEEGRTYSFKDVFVDVVNNEKILKVTTNSTIAKYREVNVPQNVEQQAQMLSPVYSIEKIQSLAEKTSVRVEGTVAEIKPVEAVKKENLQKFQLKDETGSIWITLWRKDTEQLRGTSVGDFVQVTNLKTNCYYESVSLNSTDYTRINKVQSAAVQNVIVKIEGVIKAGGMESELQVEINHQLSTFIVSSRLLADALGIRLQGNFEDKLLEKMPFSGEAEIRGNRILKLRKKPKPMRI